MTRERAKRLRKEMTEAEQFVWFKLRDRRFAQFKFRLKVPIGRYIVDFVCFECKVILELDGSQHAERQEYDAARTRWFEVQGYRVLRFWNREVFQDWDMIEQVLWDALHPSPPSALPQGERGD